MFLVIKFIGWRSLFATVGSLPLLGRLLQVIASEPTLGAAYCGRVVAGLGIGVTSSVTPVFAAERVPRGFRGIMASSGVI